MTDFLRTRPARRPEELALVRSSWRRGYFRSDHAGPVPREVWLPVYETIINTIIARPEVEIMVAENPGVAPPDDLYGWMAYERETEWHERDRVDGYWQEVAIRVPVVHFLFVKESFRGHGVAARLLMDAGIDTRRKFIITSMTNQVSNYLRHHSFCRAMFAPSYLRRRRKGNTDAQASPVRGVQSSD